MSCLFQCSWNEAENCIVDIVKYVGEQSYFPGRGLLNRKWDSKDLSNFPCISNAIDVALLNAHCKIFSHFLQEKWRWFEIRDFLKVTKHFSVSCIVQIRSWLTAVKNDGTYSKPALAFQLKDVLGGNMQDFRLTSTCLARGWQWQGAYSICRNMTVL